MHDEGVEGIEELEELEARTPVIARKPKTPTKAEIDAHFPLHADYRDWCPHCLAGKGISNQHRRGDNAESIGTTVSMDYLFMVPEEEDENMDAVLILYDTNRKSIWTMSVDKKGPTPSTVKWVVDKLEEIGYSGMEVTLKSDQEPAILDLKRDIAIKRQTETVMVESPVRESKANGSVERAVRTWQGQFRTLRHQFEQRIGTKIRKGSSMMSWLVSFASEVLSKYKVHSNGRTSYEMITGHRCKHMVCGFGEKVHFKTTSEKSRRNKMDTEWDVGYLVGFNARTTESLIGTEMGIISCATMRRLQDDLAYDKQCLEDVNVGYREYVCKGASSTNPRVRWAAPMAENKDPMPFGEPAIPRRMRIKPSDLQTHGYTIGCPGCEAVQLGTDLRRNHTEDCRVRIEGKVRETEEGQGRMDRAKARLDEWTADAGKAELPEPQETPNSGGAAASGSDPMNQDGDQLGADDHAAQASGQAVDEEVKLEDNQLETSDVRFKTPERAPAVKRHHFIGTPDDDMDDDVDHSKVRRLSRDEDMGASSIKTMNEDDRRILASAILGVDVTEIYSPERIAKVAAEFGLVQGSSMDLTNGWDFSRGDHRRAAMRQIEKEDPYVLIGSPPCTYFSMLMELNIHNQRNNPEWMEKYGKENIKAIEHVNFCCSLYERQLSRGKHFLHEHPWSARSWGLGKINKLFSNPAVSLTQGHMCQFGMETYDDRKLGTKGPVKKPTGFMTSSRCISEELDKRCDNSHKHIPLVGGRAAGAAIYPRGLCEAVSR